MVPRTTRRRYLSGLAIAASASLGGCLGDALEDGDSDDGDGSGNESGGDERASDGDADDAAASGSPAETLRQYVATSAETDDPAEVGAYFHPIHPFHPDNLDDDAEAWLLRDDPVSEIETETADRDVTPDAVLSAPVLQAADVGRDAVVDALDGERTAVVDVTITDESGATTEFSAATVTADGEWSILAQAIGASDGDSESSDESDEPAPFEARVVDEVAFFPDEDRARVHFVDSPAADSVTAAAENAFSSRSSSTPETITYFDLSLDPEGDEVLVTATVDGETRPVHREQYPPSDRAVDEVIFDEQSDNALFDATARVEFTGEQTGDRIAVESTVRGDEASIEPAGNATHLTVGVDPEGDEVVVTLTEGDETEELHRERYYA
ncbi:hypothetical protein ACFQDG_07480 [Natronoarchaeum mannanilyticum]|uniref:Uncharacterized protein n=1 Tax=Natronoarchaeum mannanilyticum TaxID=926360 RepID=A0AAV3TA79_9EURY